MVSSESTVFYDNSFDSAQANFCTLTAFMRSLRQFHFTPHVASLHCFMPRWPRVQLRGVQELRSLVLKSFSMSKRRTLVQFFQKIALLKVTRQDCYNDSPSIKSNLQKFNSYKVGEAFKTCVRPRTDGRAACHLQKMSTVNLPPVPVMRTNWAVHVYRYTQ